MKKKVFLALIAIFSLSIAMLAGCEGGFSGAGAGMGGRYDCEHEYSELLTIKAPTCTSEGEAIKICRVCKSVEVVTYDKLEHSEEVMPEVAATCIAEGLTEGKKCSVCGVILVAQQKTAKTTEHRLNNYETFARATCTESGSSLCVCQDCGEYVYVTDEALGHNLIYDISGDSEGENLSVEFYCSRSECNYSGSLSGISKIQITTSANCADYGAADLTLSDGTSVSVVTKKSVVHSLGGKSITGGDVIDYEDYLKNKAHITLINGATEPLPCNKNSTILFECDVCKVLFMVYVGYGLQHTIPGNFDYTNEENYKAPTPTESGFIKYSCTKCGKNVEEELPAHPHDIKCRTVTDGEKRYLLVSCADKDCPDHKSISDIFDDENPLSNKNCVIDISGVLYLNDNGEIVVNQDLALSKGLTLAALSEGGFELTISAPALLEYFSLTQPITTVIYYYAN